MVRYAGFIRRKPGLTSVSDIRARLGIKHDKIVLVQAGVVAERLAYDAWGKRRNPNGTDDTANILTASATTRGYTDHEMIDELDLVNMNGRVYDPALGRFLSADPFIHDVTNSQDLNRYSYVHNNPLSYTDMNGYGFFKSVGKFFKSILKPLLAIVVAILIIHFGPVVFGLNPGAVIGTTAADITLGQGAIIAGVAGGTSNVVLTGKPKAFLSGFVQGALTAGIGSAFNCNACLGKAITHGVVSGGFAEAQGGKFSSGFLAAGFSTLAGGLGDLGNKWSNSAFRAAVGGTASILGGGKFADGAVTGAFAYLFNDLLHGGQTEARLECDRAEPGHCFNRICDNACSDDGSGKQAISRAGPTTTPEAIGLGSSVASGAGSVATGNLTSGALIGSGVGAGGLIVLLFGSPLNPILADTQPTSTSIDRNRDTIVIRSVIIQRPYSEVVAQAARFSLAVNAAKIPYKLLEQNSNSYAFTQFGFLTGSRPTVSQFSYPGASTDLCRVASVEGCGN